MEINRLALIALIAVLVLYGFFLAHKTNLVTADLGRHIVNGKIILDGQTDVLYNNFYSYTQPDHSFINHHWLSGLIFYLFYKVGGFVGVHLLFTIISLFSLGILFWFSQKRSSPGLTLISFLLISPLLLERLEIRPEAFSYLLAVLFFVLLWRYKENKIGFKWLAIILVALEILWVNLHIYFVLGLALIIVFLLSSILKKRWIKTKELSLLFLTTTAVTLINPFDLKGVLAPLLIFKDYGYRLAENQSIWFIQNIISNPNFNFFKIVFLLGLTSLIAVFVHKRKSFSWELLFLFSGFSFISWLAIRNITIFAFFMIPFFALTLKEIILKSYLLKKEGERTVVGVGIVLIIFILIGGLSPLFPVHRSLGLGIEEENKRAIDFIKENNIKGPIFNNYDIGGYLIFYLYPEEKVFVDNRPEAYGTEFFQNIYIPAQEEKEEWNNIFKEYKFNAIIFSHNDVTPWGQNFLVQMVKGEDWTPVFVDKDIIIFLNNSLENKKIIDEYKIPLERFKILEND